jgi:hypothetical protein
MRRFTLILTVLAALTVWVAAASGDGGPSPGVDQAGEGIVSPSGTLRYLALPAGNTTVIAAVRVKGGLLNRLRIIRGRYGIPFVTNSGVTGGLARDGSLLVLGAADCCGLRATSRFLVLRTRTMRTYRHLFLSGDFAYDALSPDGRTLYLIEHTSADDFSRYRVRAYDLPARRLKTRVIVDRREPNEVMRGYPAARTTSTDGTWVYTLYAGGRKPFVHALDTVDGEAFCLDLPWRGSQDKVWRMVIELGADGRTLVVRGAGKRLEVERPG